MLTGIAAFFPTDAQKIEVSYDTAASREIFSGKVYLYLSKYEREPKNGAVGMQSFPCFSITVKNIQPGQVVVFDDAANAYPVLLSDIERGVYNAQVVWDKNQGGRSIAETAGNMYNEPVKINITKTREQVFGIKCSAVLKDIPFKETPNTKELKIPSALLSLFYGRPVTIDASVRLPKDYYTQPARRFPVLYTVSGFGGNYRNFSGNTTNSRLIDTTQCIEVYLDGNCPLGHSVYANSENNGPWGDALVKELIPVVEKQFRANKARLLSGHSSGGWTVLWLQTQYPTTFTACWSSSPDPVDFRNFSGSDLYKNENMFYNKDSSLKMVATIAGSIPWASAQQAVAMENVIDRGEQLNSFNAVFSQRNKTGEPGRICNVVTGEVDRETFEHWKKYDISRYVRENWGKLKPDLEGKIRISVGDHDNFLLNRPVRIFEKEAKEINANIIFAYYAGDHFTVGNANYRGDGYKFLQQKYLEFAKNNK